MSFNMMFSKFLCFFITLTLFNQIKCAYKPTWESLDTRPLPKWYDQSKIGIFIHWGVFSVPSFGSEWFWKNWKDPSRKNHERYVQFMKKNFKLDFTYADFAPQFTAEFFYPKYWTEVFKASGAKYVILTSKHHEGFTMWPSKYSFSWNAMDVGPKRDLVGDLANAVRNHSDLHFGLYHSLFEWFNPLYLNDQKNHFNTNEFVQKKTMPELYEIVKKYKPEVIWSDGQGGGNDSYWKAKEFIAWLYNESPVKDTIVVNDRWGQGDSCKHGDFYTCHDKYNPKVLLPHKWENCFVVDKHSWGYRRDAKLSDYMTIHEIIQTIAETVSCNGNVLLNVGPTHDGRIDPIQEERLRQMGDWLKVNGEAIYNSVPWKHQNDTLTPDVWFTAKSKQTEYPFYAIVLKWPENNQLNLGVVKPNQNLNIKMLGYNQNLKSKNFESGIQIEFPNIPFGKLPSQVAWVLKFDNKS